MMGIYENLTVLDPKQVTRNFKRQSYTLMKQENKSPFSLYIKVSILISLGDFKLLPRKDLMCNTSMALAVDKSAS